MRGWRGVIIKIGGKKVKLEDLFDVSVIDGNQEIFKGVDIFTVAEKYGLDEKVRKKMEKVLEDLWRW
ncbi:hypothetical protein DRP07_00725 [Archaeoglobales archaeon]|nr:MAG: hypothetical protein DRP07_00725 [Archaeoglobales archaeon]